MCFLIGGYTEKGGALLGSVSDDPYDIRTFLRRDRFHIGTELTSTTEHTLTERGYFANPEETTRGLSENGIAFTCAMIIECEEVKGATRFVDLTTEMMQSCKSLEEAIELFSSQKAISPSYSLVLADAQGGLVHLEVGSQGTRIYERFSRKERGVVLAVNCYLSGSLLDLNAPHTQLSDRENNNAARRERGGDLAEGALSVERIAEILSDHSNEERDPMENPILEGWGYSICNHGTRHRDDFSPEDLPWGTVSAEILDPSSSTFWYAYGWPCGQEPTYKDQLYQERSWGEFRPFTLAGTRGMTQLVTPLGEVISASASL